MGLCFHTGLLWQRLNQCARILNSLLTEIKVDRFEDLKIPLLVVAADYWSAEHVVFERGELFPAIQASMAVPGSSPGLRGRQNFGRWRCGKPGAL